MVLRSLGAIGCWSGSAIGYCETSALAMAMEAMKSATMEDTDRELEQAEKTMSRARRELEQAETATKTMSRA